jgi:hypothetical protein
MIDFAFSFDHRTFDRSGKNFGQKYSLVLYPDQNHLELNTVIQTKESNEKKIVSKK